VLSLLIVAGSFAIRQPRNHSGVIILRFFEIARVRGHVIASPHIILSLPCRVQKRQNLAREAPDNHAGNFSGVVASLVVSAPILRATDLRGDVVGRAGPLVGVGVALFEVKPNKTLRRVRETVTAPDGKYYFNKVHPGQYVLRIGGIITPWKCAKRKCKTFRLLHHRVIEITELTTPWRYHPGGTSVLLKI
jgi:hypothetical protein